MKNRYRLAVAGFLAGLMLTVTVIRSPSQTAPTLPPGVQDVVKLVKAGVGKEVVLAHIRNAGAFYSLSVDQLIYLHQQGVSSNEIKALLGPDGSGASANPASAPVVTPTTATPGPAAETAPAPAPIPTASAPAPIVAPPAAPLMTVPAGTVSLDSFRG